YNKLLAEPIDAADALLDAHRVPRQVVVNADVRELEVDALAARLGGDKEAHVRMVAKEALTRSLRRWSEQRALRCERLPDHVDVLAGLLPSLQLHAPVDNDDAALAVFRFQVANNVLLRFTIFGEDQHLFLDAARGLDLDVVDEVEQFVHLLVAFHADR